MTNAKHTPGPWRYDHTSEEVRGPDGSAIGRFEPASGSLAAAAPDMLEALRRIAAAKPDGLDHARDVTVLERAIELAQREVAKAMGR